jgi:hypothetical protein
VVFSVVLVLLGNALILKRGICTVEDSWLSLPKGCLPSHVVPNKIKSWLVAEEFEFVQLIGEDARNTLFNYLVTLPSGTKVNVVQASSRVDSVCVSAGLPFSASQVKMLRQKSKVEREDVFSGLRLKLAPLDVGLGFGDDMVVFSSMIYYDGLTKDSFFKAVSDVDKAYSLAGWLLRKAF